MEALKAVDEANNSTNSSSSIVRSKSGERRWVVHIKDVIGKELKAKADMSSTIFIVPKFLSAAKPQHYTPQFLALGPYHHFSQDLYDMERYKLAVAKQMLHRFQSMEFNEFIAQLNSQLDLDIRACYHQRLDFDADTLALVMGIDGLFLTELLCSQVRTHDILRPLNHTIVFSRVSGTRLTNDALLRDIVKLENQIPFFVLQEILAILCSRESELVVQLFPSVLVGFCTEISPFLNLTNDHFYSNVDRVLDCAHILDLLYHMILPQNLESTDDVLKEPTARSSSFFKRSGDYSLKAVSYSCKLVLNICADMLKNFKKVFEFIGRLNNLLPVFGGLGSSVEENSIEDKTALMEAGIMVPTASELFAAGVTFKPTSSIKTIKFDPKTVTFFLPVIQLGVNSEVILRNLVAYEVIAMADCLILSRYLHLMNSFIDTAKDVKILKDAKVVVSGMKKDQEIAILFNGMMNGSIGLSPSKQLDDAINGLNAYYEGRAKVKANRLIKKYVYASWRILTLIATLMILGLLILQSFCAVYNCPRFFGTVELTGEDKA